MENKISINRNNAQVSITIKTTLGFDYSLIANENYSYQAILVRDRIYKEINDCMQRVREEAYNQGWKDAKSKRTPKKRNFFGYFGFGKGAAY